MNHTTAASNEKYNYGYIKYDFDIAHAQMDEATVYYIKLMTPGSPGFLGKIGFDNLDIDLVSIDYENVDLGQQFNNETLFSAALKNDYLNQAISILKHIKPFCKATKEDADNLNHRYFLYNILKLEDSEVIQKLEDLLPYNHKGLFEDKITSRDFAQTRQKAELIRHITALMPLDFNTQPTNQNNGSWFGEFIKNKQYNLAEEYLKPYLGQYIDRDILIKDLSLNDVQVSRVLKEMSTKNPKSVFGRIHENIKRILPTDDYLKYILQKRRYDFEPGNNQNIDKGESKDTETSHFVFPKTSRTFPGILSPLGLSDKSLIPSKGRDSENDNPNMTLFAWGRNQRDGK